VLYVTHTGANNSFYAINQTITITDRPQFLELLLITSCSEKDVKEKPIYNSKAEAILIKILSKAEKRKQKTEKTELPNYFSKCRLLQVTNDSIKDEGNENYFNALTFKYDQYNRITAIIPSLPSQPSMYFEYLPNTNPGNLVLRNIIYKSPKLTKTRALQMLYYTNYVINYRYRLQYEMLVEFDGDTIPKSTSILQYSQYFYTNKLDSILTRYTYYGKNFSLIKHLFIPQANGNIAITKVMNKVGGGSTTQNNLVAMSSNNENYFYFNYKPLYYYLNAEQLFGDFNGMTVDPYHQLFTNEPMLWSIYSVKAPGKQPAIANPVLDFGFSFIKNTGAQQNLRKINFSPSTEFTANYFIQWDCAGDKRKSSLPAGVSSQLSMVMPPGEAVKQ
jgi:hypothetical protein